MQNKKIVFFDIDGTIWNSKNEIPDSTVKAIGRLKENGHLVFLCTGRSRAYVRNPKLLDLGFDGIVSGCGTMIEFDGKVIFSYQIENSLVEKTIQTVRRYGFRPILEGKEFLYMDDFEFGNDLYGKKLKAEMGEHLLSIEETWGKWDICKLSCATEGNEKDACFAELEEYYDYMIHNPFVAEFVPKGFHKGTGIQKVCELLEIDIAKTYAFGDSANDLGMFQTAGTSVAMGNGSETAKAAADYVTSSLEQDGIWNGCKHFGLI